jgi:hypothetical protein
MSRNEEKQHIEQFLATRGATKLNYMGPPLDASRLCELVGVGPVAGAWQPPKEDPRAYNFSGKFVGSFNKDGSFRNTKRALRAD